MIPLDEQQVQTFLNRNNIENYQLVKVAGDASFRSYYRITLKDKQWILMFAPPGYEDIKPFIAIDNILVEHGFSAPKIFAVDEKQGFILLEDFNDDTYSKVLARQQEGKKELELELYKKACDCLIELHNITPPKDVPLYDETLLLKEVQLFVDWYVPFKKIEMSDDEKALFSTLFIELFNNLSTQNPVLVLRDYHADNLMMLQDRQGHKQVGLLDFQDAVIGSKAYDLVSLLEDARRDLDEENRHTLFDYYLAQSGCDKAVFQQDYEILSLQRNIKIVGIFARLSVRDNKNNYLTLLPRVLKFITMRVSSNPRFLQLSNLLDKFI